MSSGYRVVVRIVMVALVALGGRAGVARAQPASDQAPPQVAADQAPAPTRATFISTSSRQWDVAIDGQPVCGTPCTYALFPLQFVTLRSQERRPVVLDVGRLPPGDLILSAQPLQHGMYAGGIVATTLGGMALAIGITFTAVGHARDSAGMTTAGLITGAAGVLSLGGGIYLMLNALPSVSVGQATPYTVGAAGRF